MKKKAVIGTSTMEEFGQRFIDAWKQGEQQDEAKEIEQESIYFTDFGHFQKILSAKRVELLRELMTHQGVTTYKLAKLLHRDTKNVYDDVAKLKAAGLIVENQGLTIPYQKISADITL